MFKSFFERNHLERNLLYIHTIHTNICVTPLSLVLTENDLKTSCNIEYMPGVLTKNSPKGGKFQISTFEFIEQMFSVF